MIIHLVKFFATAIVYALFCRFSRAERTSILATSDWLAILVSIFFHKYIRIRWLNFLIIWTFFNLSKKADFYIQWNMRNIIVITIFSICLLARDDDGGSEKDCRGYAITAKPEQEILCCGCKPRPKKVKETPPKESVTLILS